MTARFVSLLLILSVCSTASPADDPAALAPNVVPIVLNLLLVVAAIIGLAWLLRRSPLAGKSNGQLTVTSTLALGQRERLVLVKFAGRELLLGINGQRITLLSESDIPEQSVESADRPVEGFAQIIGRKS